MKKFEVELWNTEISAVRATRATIEMLPGGAKLIEENGRFYLIGTDFAAFACSQQGYVKKVYSAQ